MVKKITVIRLEDWAILFDGEDIIQQDHTIDVSELAYRVGDVPFTLNVVGAYGSALDKQVSLIGDVPESSKLSDLLPLTAKRAI